MKRIIYRSLFIFCMFLSCIIAPRSSYAQSSSGHFSVGGPHNVSFMGGRVDVSVGFLAYTSSIPPSFGLPTISRVSGDVYFSFIEITPVSSSQSPQGGYYHYYRMILQFEQNNYFFPLSSTYEFRWGTYGGFTLDFRQAGPNTGRVGPTNITLVRGTATPELTHQGFEFTVYSRQWQKKAVSATSWTNISGATNVNYSPGVLTESTMFRVRINGTDVFSDETTITLTDGIGYISPISQTINAGSSAGSLRHLASLGITSRQWQKSTNGSTWIDIQGATGDIYSPGNLVETTDFRIKLNQGNSYTDKATVIVNPVGGSISPANQNVDSGATIKTLTHTGPGVTSRQWQKSTNGITWTVVSGATGSTYSPAAVSNSGTSPIEHYYRVKINGQAVYSNEARITVYPIGSTVVSLTNTHNYTAKYVLREAKTLSSLPTNLTTAQAMPSVTYYDGLGRPIQQTEVGAGAERQDIVMPIEYDAMGNADAKQHLPYNGHNGSGRYRMRAIDDKTDYYTSRYDQADADRSFMENKYDASLLNRIVESYRPGKDYLPTGKKSTHVYGANAANEVRKLIVSGTTSYTFAISSYPAKSLNKETVTDEDGKITQIFTDFRGNTVLERVASSGGSNTHDTYYSYDDRGLLCMVVSPEGSLKLNIAGVASIVESNTNVQNYCYLYRYDHRQRMTDKKLPGVAVESYSYDDPSDRIKTRTQNGRVWTYSYDNLGRPTQEKLGSIITAEYRYDTYTGTPAAPTFASETGVVSSHNTNVTGFKTYERVALIEGVVTRPTYVERAFYYDTKGWLVQTVERNHLGGISRYSTSYDFTGNVLVSFERHQSSSNATYDYKKTTFTYDHRSRPTKEVTIINGATTSTATVAYAYDELGKLVKKTYGTGTTAVIENLTYNIQGWLRNQSSDLFDMQLHYYDPRTANRERWAGDIAEMRWQHKGHLAPSSYSANAYTFTYDEFSRLKSYYHELCSTNLNPTHPYPWGSPARSFLEDGITYDRNGNILSLRRVGSHAISGLSYVSDNLTYSYTGNKLTSLTHNNATGSVSQAGSYGYEYDAVGNMTKNLRDGMVYDYNYLNLLGDVKVANGAIVARYNWLADGTKAAARNLLGTQGFDYLGSLIYKRTGTSTPVIGLESTDFDGGRINKTSSGYEVNYHITDHLGSVRVVFKDKNNVLARNDFYAFGKKHMNGYLPSGDDAKNRWLFNGKEAQLTGDLRLLDYGARMYDPEIVRMQTPDPWGEDRPGMSPFAYAANNPVNLIDWLGLEPQKPEEDHQKYLLEQQIEYEYASQQLLQEVTVWMSALGHTLWSMINPVEGFKNARDKLDAGESLSAGDVADVALDIIGIIPGAGVLKAAKTADNVIDAGTAFFDGARYTEKVLRGMDNVTDLRHGFPRSVDGYAGKFGKFSEKVGSDGKNYHQMAMPGEYRGQKGVFEYIKDPRSGEINHRYFNPNRK